ncbi:unnamed protein product [Lampetra planeri]
MLPWSARTEFGVCGPRASRKGASLGVSSFTGSLLVSSHNRRADHGCQLPPNLPTNRPAFLGAAHQSAKKKARSAALGRSPRVNGAAGRTTKTPAAAAALRVAPRGAPLLARRDFSTRRRRRLERVERPA